jgi:hypothetical protein
MEKWKIEAERLKLDQGKSWSQVAAELQHYFPDKTQVQVRDKIRIYITRLPRFKKQKQEDRHNSSIEYKKDGSIVSEKFITVRDGDEMTPEFIIEAHGLKPSAWEVVSYKNNFWNSQLKGGFKQISYQSKLTVRPRKDGISFDDIDDHFKRLDRKFKPMPIKYQKRNGSKMAEVNIADLHFGKLCWRGDTGNNFDYKIARDMFYNIIGRIHNELRGKDLEYILFVWSNDFFNSDTIDKTTTGGTPQDTDVRWQKLFNIGVEMLVKGITTLSEIAPVKTFYTASNHDEQTGYTALKYLEAWFRKDPNVEIDTSPIARKYISFGKVLLGFTHGDKEKPKTLSMLMPNEARELWGNAKYCEMHTAHLHSEHSYEEINGVIVRRISSPTATDTWHYTSGYVGAVRKAQTFIWDKELGLEQIINTPVMEVKE